MTNQLQPKEKPCYPIICNLKYISVLSGLLKKPCIRLRRLLGSFYL